MDFEEFLWAKGKELLVSEIRTHFTENTAISEILHKEAMNEYYDYLVTGGMPAVVNTRMTKDAPFTAEEVKSLIINSYVSDMSKYAGSSASIKTKGAFDSIPAQLAKENRKFQYKLIKTGARAALFGESIDWLVSSGIVLKCVKCEHGFMPPAAYQDLSAFKLYMNDVGLLASKTGISLASFASGEMNQYIGAIAENYAACALAANGNELMYWESKSIAEVDFLIIRDGGVIPVEVKSSGHNRSRSLASYNEKYKPKYMMRISSKNFGFENNIKSVPLYSVFAV
jgi:predicted AAA+ superfamily ATPase